MKRIWEKITKFLRDPATQTIIAIVTLIATIALGSVQGWLNNFIKWLLNNTPFPNWLILAFCLSTIFLGISWVKTKIHNYRSKSNVIVQNKLPIVSIDTYSTRPKAKEIIDQVLQIPPYQKSAVQKSYEGQEIKWQLRFNDILDIESDIAWIQLFVFENNSAANIYAYVDIKKYPKIKTLKVNELLFVEGEIEKLTDYSTIWLKNTSIKFSGEDK